MMAVLCFIIELLVNAFVSGAKECYFFCIGFSPITLIIRLKFEYASIHKIGHMLLSQFMPWHKEHTHTHTLTHELNHFVLPS